MAAQPLEASAKALRERRYEVNVCGPKNERGGRKVEAVGRFTSAADACEWADTEHPDSEMVTVTLFSARRGWQPQRVTTRKNGEWSHDGSTVAGVASDGSIVVIAETRRVDL